MVILRAISVFFVLAGFTLVGVPLQFLALRRGWSLRRRIPVLFNRCLVASLGVRVRNHGAIADDRARLYVPNHVSWLDIPVVATREPLCFVAKREVATWPVIGLMARLQGTIFIARERRSGIPAANAAMAARLVRGEPVGLFAEATTGCGNRLRRFHSSHFAAARDALAADPSLERVVVQPVSIVYSRRDGLPLGRGDRPRVAWYGDMDLLPHLLGVLRDGPLDCDVTLGRPVAYERGADRKVVARATEAAVRRLTAAVVTGRAPALARETVCLSPETT